MTKLNHASFIIQLPG